MTAMKDDLLLMKKYEVGRDMDPEDEEHIRELCSIGFMKTGVSIKRKRITAKTIGVGLKVLEEFG